MMRRSFSTLTSKLALASLALVIWNDLWLKRQHPGFWSGKLSDVGLCIFLPLFVAALLDHAGAAWEHVSRRTVAWRIDLVALAVSAVYFAAIKISPAATHAHVMWLSMLMPRWHFRAVTDPTDLATLPAMLAWWALRERQGDALESCQQRG